MSKGPKQPGEIVPGIVDDYKQLFGDDLVSIILYGSAATGEYIPGKSDINFMIVLSERGIDALERTFKVIARWQKRNVATPLFLTEDYIRTSLDAFPVEYLNFQKAYEVAYGKDILKDLTIDRRFLRLQCEREIKGKLLLLREAFLETQGRGRHLQQLVAQSVRAFIAIFCGLLYLEGKELPRDSRQVVRQVCETFELDHVLFERLLDISEKKMKPGAAEMTGLFQSYLREIRSLWKRVDRLDVDVEG
jgi:predicted nucleotidyltransferase